MKVTTCNSIDDLIQILVIHALAVKSGQISRIRNCGQIWSHTIAFRSRWIRPQWHAVTLRSRYTGSHATNQKWNIATHAIVLAMTLKNQLKLKMLNQYHFNIFKCVLLPLGIIMNLHNWKGQENLPWQLWKILVWESLVWKKRSKMKSRLYQMR